MKKKAFIKAMILILSIAETIEEALEVSFVPAVSNYPGPTYTLLSAIAARVADIVAAYQVERVIVEVDINGFGGSPLPYELPVTANAEEILDFLYSDGGMVKDLALYLQESVEAKVNN